MPSNSWVISQNLLGSSNTESQWVEIYKGRRLDGAVFIGQECRVSMPKKNKVSYFPHKTLTAFSKYRKGHSGSPGFKWTIMEWREARSHEADDSSQQSSSVALSKRALQEKWPLIWAHGQPSVKASSAKKVTTTETAQENQIHHLYEGYLWGGGPGATRKQKPTEQTKTMLPLHQ